MEPKTRDEVAADQQRTNEARKALKEAWVKMCVSVRVPWTEKTDKSPDDLIRESRRLDIIPSVASQLTANVSTNSHTGPKDPNVKAALIRMVEQEIQMFHLPRE